MNLLANETSPYLLQHAHNPVYWYPWGEEALKKAQKEQKPIIISIGYSACHWCHVMERESFENAEIAEVMNEHFVCIKIDREERPDIDAIYMDALQAMGLRGGWPLNVFLMPDQRPFYGGTYFPALQWKQLLENIGQAFSTHYEELSNSADEFAQHISVSEIQKYGLLANETPNSLKDLDGMYQNLSKDFDKVHGGMAKAPKFPMPSIWRFLLQYAYVAQNQEAQEHLEKTLQKMAFGGIYDQIGGGFARYSVDGEWFCPHFEKMLYDNAQLLTLYAEVYSFTKKDVYKEIVYEIIQFVTRELKSSEGGFFSALDADSEGEEGKFYIWKKRHLEEILTNDIELFCKYYNITNTGNWEFGNNILYKNKTDEDFAKDNDIEINILKEKIQEWKRILLKEREQRIRPALDDKILAGWNGLMLKGLSDAYKVFGEKSFLDLAEENANFLINNMTAPQGFLWRTYKNGTAKIQAYLEDYACIIEGMLALYQVTFNSKYYQYAQTLLEYTIENFYDKEEGMFFYTDKTGEELITRKKEIFDNVIPSSNSVMAQNLYFAGILFDNQQYKDIASEMLSRMNRVLSIQMEYVANWAWLYAFTLKPTAEIVIIGEKLEEFRKELEQYFYPYKILVGSKQESMALPILENRTAINKETTLYVCFDKTCQLPTFSIQDAIKQFNI
jgi:hypothetical protein